MLLPRQCARRPGHVSLCGLWCVGLWTTAPNALPEASDHEEDVDGKKDNDEEEQRPKN
jgi:hypothetical protein